MARSAIDLALSCLRLALRPLIRFGLRHSVRLNEFLSLLKEEFVFVAVEELTRRGEKPTDSKISVMTGVHRKDISKWRDGGEAPQRKESIVARVIGTWRNDPKFSGSSGPRTLSDVGTASEFAKLVGSISNDVAPYAVLFELERSGIIERTSRGVKLRSQSYVLPAGESAAGFTMLGEDISDLTAVVEENIRLPKEERSLHLKTEFSEISESSAEKLRVWLLAEGSRIHRRVERVLASEERRSSRNRKGTERKVRVSYCSFAKIG